MCGPKAPNKCSMEGSRYYYHVVAIVSSEGSARTPTRVAQLGGLRYLFGIKIWLCQDLSLCRGRSEQRQDAAQQGGPPSPGQSSGPWRPPAQLGSPARQWGSADAQLGERKAPCPRKLQALFAHCLARSLECPHLLRESFPGGSREPGPHLARVPATSVTAAQPVGLPPPASSPQSPQSPHLSPRRTGVEPPLARPPDLVLG